MAAITYTRTFAHTDWIDGESIVQAAGENGVNSRFHGCEQEFDKISGVVGQINTAIQNLQQLQFLVSQPTLTVAAATSSAEFDVEIYDRTTLPANIDKAYFCVIFPVTGVTVLSTFLYHQIPANKVRVTVAFFNPTTAPISFGYRVLALATQSS